MKEFSEACERNKDAIFAVIEPLLKDKKSLLEIGSGTGQHAVYFAEKMNHLCWQTSDRLENHPSINTWIDDSHIDNVETPIDLDVLEYHWSQSNFDAAFSANTAHIMPWRAVEAMFEGVANSLNEEGLFFLYGPFNYNGQFTSESNKNFESWLKSVDPERGIRDFEAVIKLAKSCGIKLVDDIEMPANNRILIWRKDN